MARGSPLLQEPDHVLIRGNRQKAIRWLTWAKKRLHALQSRGVWHGTRVFDPRADVRVLIRSIGPQKTIEIIAGGGCDLYVESGILDHLTTAPLHPDTYRPAQLHFTDALNAARAPNFPNGRLEVATVTAGVLKAENRDEGESRAIGCDDDDKLTTLSLEESHHDASAPWCPAGEFLDQKQAQIICPASQFTGKLQLHVQAIYGSERRDYSVQPDLLATGLDWEEDGWIPYQFSWRAATGLFTGADFRYWLIVVDVDGVRAQRLVPTGCGPALRRWLVRHAASLSAEQLRRYETYLLSTLEQQVGPGKEGLVNLGGDIDGAYDHGEPWYYGWHFNYRGNEAHAVAIRHKPGTSFGGSDHRWQSTLLRLTITESSDKTLSLAEGRLQVNWAVAEGPVDWTHDNNIDLVWFPNPLGGMEAFVPEPLNTGNEVTIDCDAPMYCFYDRGDQLRVVRFERATLPDGYEKIINPGQLPDPNNFKIDCNESYGIRLLESADNAVRTGFYVEGGLDMRILRLSGYTGAGTEAWITSSAPTSTSPNKLSGGPTELYLECQASFPQPGGAAQQSIQNWATTGGRHSVQGTLDVDVETLLLVPWHDASSVYLSNIQKWNDTIGGASFTSEVSSRSRRYFDAEGNVIVDGASAVEPVWWMKPFQDLIPENSIAQSAIFRDDMKSFTGAADVKHLRVSIANRFGAHEDAYRSHGGSFPSNFYLVSQSILGSGDVNPGGGVPGSFAWGGWQEFFDPLLLISPFSLNFCSVRASFDSAFVADRSPTGTEGRVMEDFDYDSISTFVSHVGHA